MKGITRRVAKILEENSGIEAQFENKDIEDYVKVVVTKREKMIK